ncbi:hypothetical protein ADIWIN_4056 [Winogradskyella psychrotolerans RS-3]|uniref:TonB C-terminal domain-containing protein n=1 Tax=Winogradskyella psychrotolerans RS-3 TaxID=641526 RepID=S7VIJ3_9FLAO|nr:hypothetical protein [Winogradskyella psychrotolerans]EPR69781.1 hypothetical protein ADIWIN_4056 [Winogradskyella psychrotolerans RS-3]
MNRQKTFRLILFLLIVTTLFFSCKDERISKVDYLRHVGDAQEDSLIDNPDFKICFEDHVFQYFNFSDGPQYIGEKPELEKIFKQDYKPITDNTQNGSIRIRFIVNCEGKAGRFRVIQADSSFKETKFNETITTQLLEITKGISQWKIVYNENQPIDYYAYLIFKIKEGHISEILP